MQSIDNFSIDIAFGSDARNVTRLGLLVDICIKELIVGQMKDQVLYMRQLIDEDNFKLNCNRVNRS
jgi:hypothetical protein